jgi:hypothetical protein
MVLSEVDGVVPSLLEPTPYRKVLPLWCVVLGWSETV